MNHKKSQKPLNPYQKAAIETASPGKIILMLYDGALKFLAMAKEGFELENPIRRNETVNNNIIRTLNIVAELQNSLDADKGDKKLTETLDKLYAYVYTRLTEANVKKDKELIPDAEKVLKDLRDSWAEMLLQAEESKPKITSLSQTA